MSCCGPAENARYAERSLRGEEEEGDERASDTRDPEAWPVVFCLARIDVEGGNGWPWKKNEKEVNARRVKVEEEEEEEEVGKGII